MQINHITKKEYTGKNEDILKYAQELLGFSSNEWITFLQAKKINKTVLKGNKGVKIVRVIEKINKKGLVENFVKSYTVFNIAQLTDLNDTIGS